MEQFGYIVKHWLRAAAAPVAIFLRRANTKLLWAFGSAIGLIIGTASFAAINHDDTDQVTQSSAAQVQDIDAQSEADSPDTNIRSETVIKQTQQTTSGTATPPRTSLRVNGTPIMLPKQGTIHKDIRDGNGRTTVDVSIDTTSTGSSSSTSSSSVTLESTTESTNDTIINMESSP